MSQFELPPEEIDYLRSLPDGEALAFLDCLGRKDPDARDWLLAAMMDRAGREGPTEDETDYGSPRQNLLKYCPHTPWPKQQAVLDLRAREIFFGGAKGPGKTDLLLMGALRYVHVPGYAALIIRRDLERLKLPGAIFDRAKAWWAKTDVQWSGYTAIFPSGATIQFGYMNNPDSRFRYQGGEYCLICWDELTEFPLSDNESNPYLYMFGMNRRVECEKHQDESDPDCYQCRIAGELTRVPLQVISASNPGGESHVWVKDRFITQEAQDALKDGEYHDIYWVEDGERCFVPALIRDNPALNAERYERESLAHLPPVTRRRYMAGDWTIQENALIDPTWVRRYYWRGDFLVLARPDLEGVISRVHVGECARFATIDTAGTSEQMAQEKKGKPASWSVCSTWLWYAKLRFLILLNCWRKRVAYVALKTEVAQELRERGVRTVLVEGAHFGPALCPELASMGFDARITGPMLEGQKPSTKDSAKYERAVAADLFGKFERGEIWLPDVTQVPGAASWLGPVESELFAWQGQEEETADVIDTFSYASAHVKNQGQAWGGVLRHALPNGR